MNGETGFEPASLEPDGIEAGKRLVRSGAGVSLAERLGRRLRMLSWRSPLHAFRLKGRHPLKLLAVPEDAMLGDPRAGEALLNGAFLRRGETLALADLDFARLEASPGMAVYVHGFAWLRDLSTVATRAQGSPIAEAVMRKWIAAHAEQVSDLAWRPDLWGKRILFWTAHAPLILSNADLVYRSSVLNALARGSRHLERGADKAEAGVQRIAAWAGLTAAGLLIPGVAAQAGNAEAGLARALRTGLSGDGGAICRAPGAQHEVVMLLAMLRAVYRARRQAVPDAIEAALARAVPALLSVTHGDGGLASFQGSAPLGAAAVEQVVAATDIRTRPLRQARDWGYQRMAGGETVVIVDAAPPPLGQVAAGGCASTLAFEMSDGSARLIVSCGGARDSSAFIPPALIQGLRSTAAHSTLILADSNSTALHADGALGKGVTAIELRRQETDAGSRVEASHDGYAKRFGFLHDRALTLTSDGRTLTGEDRLLPARQRRAPAPAPFALRFHLAPGVDASATADGQGALLRVSGGAPWRFRSSGGALAIEQSLWVDADGRPRMTQQLVVSGDATSEGVKIGWMMQRV